MPQRRHATRTSSRPRTNRPGRRNGRRPAMTSAWNPRNAMRRRSGWSPPCIELCSVCVRYRSPADRPVVYPIDWKRRRERLHCRGNRPPASAADGTLDRADVGLSIANSVQDRQCNRIRSRARLRAHSRTRRLAEGSRRDIPSGPPSARLGGSTSSNLGCNGAEQQGIPRDGGGVCAALESRDEDGSSGRLRPSALGGPALPCFEGYAGLPLRQAPC